MRSAFILSASLLACLSRLVAQSPFEFRELWLIEHRIEVTRSGEEYDPNHSEQLLSSEGPGPATQFLVDRNDPNIYRTERWKDLLEQTDRYRRMGGLELARREYIDMLSGLRQAQGPDADDVALLLDHIGEFYLEVRDFSAAYQSFSGALDIRRRNIAALPPATIASAPNTPGFVQYHTLRLHTGDLLTRLGQLDLARGDLDRASQHLSEAVAIANEPVHQRFVFGLYAIYFQSLALERQQKWQEAEKLWQDAASAREKLFASEPYWNAQKEMAAFYARKGDFHAAAALAQKVKDGIAGKQLRPELPMPYLDSRPRAVINQPQNSLYLLESNTAMNEILAIDKWRTAGPEAAAPLLNDLVVPTNRYPLDRGSDSERTQMLAWFEHRAFLHMSVLLDGQPAQDRIDKAWATISEIKGRYLSAITGATRDYEQSRANPQNQLAQFAILDQLAAARQLHSHLFVQTALDGKPLDAFQFAARENAERILTSAVLAGPLSGFSDYFSVQSIQGALTPDTAFIDIVAWDRLDREPSVPAHREYGAFVVRAGQPVRFISLGPADGIDADIDALHAGVLSGRPRGLQVESPKVPEPAAAIDNHLRSLYRKVFAPLAPALEGARNLYIAPDGKLTTAPLSALIDEQGHHVFESRSILYMGSWRDITSSVYRGSMPSSPPAIIANPDFDLSLSPASAATLAPSRAIFKSLPGAEAEASDVALALKVPNDRVLTGKTALQSTINSLHSPETLHFATHSVPHFKWKPPASAFHSYEFPQPLDTQYPLLQSMIALAGANRAQSIDADGLLTGLDVSSLHLQGTNLVVLSSCESGQGTLLDGQGVQGLRAAFTMAGARATVMTLWPVDDVAGRRFMQFFYAHLSASPAEAVRLAQLDMIAKSEYKNPFYWSGYVVSGSPVIPASSRPKTPTPR